MTLSVNINGLEAITEAINRLAVALGSKGISASLTDKTQNNPQSGPGPQQAPQPGPSGPAAGSVGGFQQTGSAPVTQSLAPQTGWPAGMPAVGGGQMASASAAGMPTGPLPTTATPQAYTQDQIAVAMTGLVDQGKQPQVMQVLSQFGAASLMQVQKDQYPALAAQLRMLGAAI